jgi:putative transposase
MGVFSNQCGAKKGGTPMQTVFAYRSLHEKIKEFYGFFSEHIEDRARQTTEQLLEEALKAEIDILVDAERYERCERRKTHRNGHYVRHLISHHGLLKIRVPRVRHGKVAFQTIARYRRYSGEVAELVRGLFFAGVSTRKMGVVLEQLLGSRVSAQMVSRITQQFDREVQLFHSRLLGEDYSYLFLDGIVQSEQVVGSTMRGPLLVAYGITHDGRREVIGYMKAMGESDAAWGAFLDDLYRRGLTGERLKLIVADGAPGLWSALERVYPRVPKQLCWAHKIRNVQDKLPKRAWDTCLRDAKEIYQQPTRKKATERYFKWVRKWKRKYPKAVKCLAKDIDRLLVHYSYPLKHRITIRTTNPIERLFVEVRRRTRPIGSFKNTKSLDRIAYGIFWTINRMWEDTCLTQFTQNS